MLLKNHGSMMNSKRKLKKKSWDKLQWKQNHTKIYGLQQNQFLERPYSDRGLSQKTRKRSQINNLTYHLKELDTQP